MKNKAVVLGANYYIGLSVARCLGKEGISVALVDYKREGSYAFDSKYCAEILIAPHYKKEEQAYLDFLVDYAKKQDAKPVLFPCADPYVEFIDRHFNELKEVYLFSQETEHLNVDAMDKAKLSEMAMKHGVKIPVSISIDEPDLLKKVKEIGYPVVLKPTDSSSFVSIFRIKMFKVETEADLIAKIDLTRKSKCNVFVQQIIPGFDDHMVTYDMHMDKQGEVTHWTTCQKQRQYPINFGASVFTKQKYIPELHAIGAPFFKAIHWRGFAEIEFKKHAQTGEYYLIEINVRTTNFNAMLAKIGLNFPYIAYRELTGDPLPAASVEKDTNVHFWYMYEDLLAIRDYLHTKQLTRGEIFSSFRVPIVEAVYEKGDTKPFFSFLSMVHKKLHASMKRKMKR
ncbi:MAG: carboxylate--amine ligase [Erysipelotrichaceae bacterium]